MRQDIRDRIDMIRNGEVPEGYKKTKIGIIPEEWEESTIDKVLNRIREPVKVKEKEEYFEIGIRSHGKGIFYKKSKLGKELGNKSVFWIEEGCFIVNIVFAWEQAVAKTTKKELGLIASHRFPMYKPKEGKLDLDFILYLFKTKYGKYLLELASPGGAGRNKTLGQTNFKELKVIFPSFKEQTKIANILSIWDKAIEKQEELIELKKEQKKGLMQELLTGKKRLKGFSGEWEEVRLEEIAEIKKGTQLSKINMIENGEYPVLNGGITFSGYTNFWNTEENTITISEGGNSCGYINFIVEKFWSGGHCYTILEKKCEKFFLYQTLKLNEVNIMRLRVGSGLPNIQKGDIENVKLKLPQNIAEQKAIAEILSTADKEIDLLEKELDQIKEQKKGLMQLLLTGIVRV